MWISKFKALIANESSKDSKKKTENLVVFVILLIITVIAINNIWNTDKKKSLNEDEEDINPKQLANSKEVSANIENSIEKNLEDILCKIEGVGKVKVLITYSESSEVVAMYNENNKNSLIEEKDSGRWNKNYNPNGYCKRYYI